MALLSRADQDQTEDELKWSDDEEEDGQTGGQTGDDKEETVVTEQPGTSELKKVNNLLYITWSKSYIVFIELLSSTSQTGAGLQNW